MRSGSTSSSVAWSSTSTAVEHGAVTSVEVNPASDLLVLDGGGLVPLIFVTERADGRITVDAPDGLFD